MCEESAYLVSPLEQPQNGPSEPILLSASNGGGVGTSGEALVGFHEDALSQAAVGRAQLLLALVLGLGIAAECSELSILGFILPAAELQLCIDEHKKGWLVSITLLALAAGSLAWGILGDNLGRRRALMSALSVAVIFSAVAAVMPTYGTFMTARFCSGLGLAGAFPLSFSYLAETCPRATRTRYTGLLHSFWPLGALLTSTMAHLTLPSTGPDIVLDTREHWSSWHKFLILNTMPPLACIVGLMWTSESPRYLLEASREVEALEVYQRLHKLNKSRTQYGLTELELPSRSAYRDRSNSPSRNVISHGFTTLRDTFQRMSSPSHFRTTSLLAALHLIMGFVFMGISTFSTLRIKYMNDLQYYSMRRHVRNTDFSGMTFNSTIENVQYAESIFRNVTFSKLDFNHVEFADCLFEYVKFSNVKSSITYFINSTIKDSRFVDTDFTADHFINCNLINNTMLSLVPECLSNFDYNTYLDDLYHETIAWAAPMVPVLLFIGFILETVSRSKILIVLLILGGIGGIGIFFTQNFVTVLVVEAMIKVWLMCSVNVITMIIIEGYPCHLRCTAQGMMRSLFHVAALCSIPIYGALVDTILLLSAALTLTLISLAIVLSTKIQDNSKVLL